MIGDIVIIKKKQNLAAGRQDTGVLRGRCARVINMKVL